MAGAHSQRSTTPTVGLWYIGAALLFLILGGILALVMRVQLAVPQNDLVDHDLYNQLFTMHGSVMMFLFAVPVVEAIGILLLPAMQGARDLPFPRLSAYAFWAYFVGGLVFFTTIFFDLAPDGGWFMYPPLTSYEYSPGLRTDFWLLGIGFIEISAIAGAIEIVVGILRTRPPGMTLDKMPIYLWAMLIVGAMIIFAFPPVILATALLELERAFHWPFFVAAKGGDPLLWQHLFWLFGHPDVYIIFLPAAGLVSMIVATMARTPLIGYRWIVVAMLATGAISFALWVHHMFATGMPHLSLSFFSAASMAVAIPAGLQVFSWLATLWRGNVQRATPKLFPARLLRRVRARRTDGRHACCRALRLAGARHVFRRRAPALRTHRRLAVSGVRRDLLLGAAGQRQAALRTHGHVGMRAAVRRRQSDVLSDAYCRPARHAAPRVDLQRGARLG